MITRAGSGKQHHCKAGTPQRTFRPAPLPAALALALAVGAIGAHAPAAAAGGNWFAQTGAGKTQAANGAFRPVAGVPGRTTLQQQQQSRQQLQRSLDNLGRTASAIAAQQSAQAAARAAAQNDPSVPDGYQPGGLWDNDAAGNALAWTNADRPQVSAANGKTTVAINQTADKAILNWDTFNVGRNTSVEFRQQADWAVLNRVNDPQQRPSQIQGQIKGDGTVMVVNRNGIVFSGSSQVNVRNLVAAAVDMTDEQFGKGIYGDVATVNNQLRYTPSFGNSLAQDGTSRNAVGDVTVLSGAQISTNVADSAIQGGGYVLMLGRAVANAGHIETPNGQTLLAAGDNFIIRRGYGSEGNPLSTTRGNEVASRINTDSLAGAVSNAGLIVARTGDITLTGRTIAQQGVAVATTDVTSRGSVHLQNSVSDTLGSVTLSSGSTTAVLVDENADTALDAQWNALSGSTPTVQRLAAAAGLAFDNVGELGDQSNLSRIEIVTGGSVDFQGQSLTLATGGQIAVHAVKRSLVRDGAELDVSGAVGVRVAMEANNLNINVQGNEQRDAPVNRDSGLLNNSDVWVDRRQLVFVPAGTNGYETDRWYTSGGLLEVGGYLGTAGHGIGEWLAQGGSVNFAGSELVTQRGSTINLSGGTLDVQSGYINLSWVRGADGRLYELSSAPGDLLYRGLYKGFEDAHARWGDTATRYYYNPLIAPQRRFEAGYTVGRDAGRLLVGTASAVLEGNLVTETFQGDRQINAAQGGLDGYQQSQMAVARGAQLILGRYNPGRVPGTALGNDFIPTANHVVIGAVEQGIADALDLVAALPEDRLNGLYLDAQTLNSFKLGSLLVGAKETITVNGAIEVVPGGEIGMRAPQTSINASLTARSGAIHLGDLSPGALIPALTPQDPATVAGITIGPDVTLDTRGLWTNLRLNPEDRRYLPFIDGGEVSLRSSGSVLLGAGSVVDVSSGAAMQADRSVTGGKGGSVTLGALGSLVLGGDILGYGVSGSGSLSIESGKAVGIGGDGLDQAGILQAGEIAPVALKALEAFSVQAGDISPADFTYLKDWALPGEVMGGMPAFSSANPVVLAAAWVLPLGTGSGSGYRITYIDGNTGREVTTRNILSSTIIEARIIPANSRIVRASGLNFWPVGYVVDGNALPAGLPMAPTNITVKGGQVAPVAASFAAGTMIPAGMALTQAIAVESTQVLNPQLFQNGFASYSVKSQQGIVVAAGTTLSAVQPVLRPLNGAMDVLTGAEPSSVFERWTPTVFQENPATGVFSQRRGSGLALIAEGGNIAILRDALVEVDPGQTISLKADKQVDIHGTLRAPGGSIQIAPAIEPIDPSSTPYQPSSPQSIRVYAGAMLDVAGFSVTATDIQGRTYGRQYDGGDITLAARPDTFVVIEAGGVLDASGSAMTISAAQPSVGGALPEMVNVAGSGGAITLSSSAGLYLNGEMRAAAGGVGGAGGTLALMLETPLYASASLVSDAMRRPSELLIVQQALQNDLALPSDDRELAYGYAKLGVDQVSSGGFDSLSLYARDLITFDGNIDLRTGQAIRLYQGVIGNTTEAAQVNLAAPYVLLSGRDTLATVAATGSINATLNAWQPSQQIAAAAFTVQSDLLDIQNVVRFGINGSFRLNSGSLQAVDRRGYDQVVLSSRGDMRFLPASAEVQVANSAMPGVQKTSAIVSPYNIELAAARIYPTNGAQGVVAAGFRGAAAYDPNGVLRITRTGANDQAPMSVFGSLELRAATVEQGGAVFAPLGRIALGLTDLTQRVSLLPGSLTSVSAAGLVLPYGGTSDDLTYTYNDQPLTVVGVGGVVNAGGGGVPGTNGIEVAQGISISAATVVADSGSVLDLSGGGELTGSAFISGRGGSTDPLLNALVRYDRSNGTFTLPSLASNPVYAIVPTYQAAYAPVTPVDQSSGYAGSQPRLGEQITIGAGVPGLPAGTYTLLPSFYALLPGAYRVELGGQATVASSAMALRNGSWMVSGTTSIANSGVKDALARQVTVTAGDVLRKYGQYNETSYRDFILSAVARTGTPRPMLPDDAKALQFRLPQGAGLEQAALSLNGEARFEPTKQGYGGQVIVGTSSNASLEIVADTATSGFTGASVRAADLNALGAARISIGGWITGYGYDESSVLDKRLVASSITPAVTVRNGASLQAPEIALISSDIRVEQGAILNTLGQGSAPYDSSLGYQYASTPNMLMVSNGWLDLPVGGGGGRIQVGTCASVACSGQAQLYSEGSIVFSANNVSFGDAVRFGTRNLTMAVSGLNIGTEAALAGALANGTLPEGLQLSQATLSRLLNGDPEMRAPALQRLIFSVKDAVNLFGTVDLSTIDPATGRSSLDQLVFNTPAIYGQGMASDIATISTGTLVWNGVAGSTPPAVLAGGAGTGAGTLDLQADQIVFGYADGVTPTAHQNMTRLALGFANVNLRAADRITANGEGSLSVYQALGAVVGGEQQYTGGNLNLITPLLTGESASVNSLKAGATLALTGPQGAVAGVNDALGATLGLHGGTVVLDGTIRLASGKLDVTADGDIALNGNAQLDLAGREVWLMDQAQYSWGGEVNLESTRGNVTQSANSSVDLSARFNQAGTLTVTALDDTAGRISLAGSILGSASGDYGAGGSAVPYDAGGIALAGRVIEDFAGLNTRLTEGGVIGSRTFRLKEGDLTIGNEVKAREVVVSVDSGSLTVDGTIDAHGRQVGVIRLSARDNLTLTGNAVLDAHGTDLRVDSYGKIIDAPNRAIVELTSGADGTGTLTLQAGATVDLRAGTDVAAGTEAGQNDGASRGTLVLNVPRIGSTGVSETGGGAPANATGGDLDISVPEQANILGARSIALYGYANYTNAPSGQGGQVVNQDYLNNIDVDNKAFILAAYANNVAGGVLSSGLQGKLAGLTAYGSAFHLRPGVEIRSATADGKITVDRDLDLSGYRYGPNASSVRGSGEPGALSLRAGGDLAIKGSINDGFGLPASTPDDGSFAVLDSQGNQTGLRSGRIWAIAPMLAAGSMSWDIRLGAGADLTAASRRALQTQTQLDGKGNLTLSDLHYMVGTNKPIFSVVRTGTGDLDLLAGGSLSQDTLYGIYTAGTQSAAILGTDGTPLKDAWGNSAFNLPRGYDPLVSTSSVLPDSRYENLVKGNNYAAWYPEQGGNVSLVVQGDLTGNVLAANSLSAQDFVTYASSNYVGNWLWRQGGNEAGQATAWWINFGSYVPYSDTSGGNKGLSVDGFTGIGALGGGNVNVSVAGDAGVLSLPSRTSQGVSLAVGSTGRMVDGSLVMTGGGDLLVNIGGALNPGATASTSGSGSVLTFTSYASDLNGAFTNLRGALDLRAGSIGRVDPLYGLSDTADSRVMDTLLPSLGRPAGGPVIVVGDSDATFSARGDLVLDGVGDPGMYVQRNYLPFRDTAGGGVSWYSLWTGDTAVSLFSAGGNLTPFTMQFYAPANSNTVGNTSRSNPVYPAQFSAVAADGSIYYAPNKSTSYTGTNILAFTPSLTGVGTLDILAGDSVYGGGFSLQPSGADPAILPTPAHPAFVARSMTSSDISARDFDNTIGGNFYRFDAFGPNTITGNAYSMDANPIRIYADTGDLVGVSVGGRFTSSTTNEYYTSKPVRMQAGRDIVNSGGVFYHSNKTDISIFQAGRDIFYGNVQVAGPGQLEVGAGRNLYQGNRAQLTSLGLINGEADRSGGASISVTVGTGAYGVDYAGFALKYTDPANLANASLTLAEQSGKVVKVYGEELTLAAWLRENYGYDGADDDASALAFMQATQDRLDGAHAADASAARRDLQRDYQQASQLHLVNWLRDRFANPTTPLRFADTGEAIVFDPLTMDARSFYQRLPAEQQRVYARNLYYAELRAGGREYNDADGPRFNSYLRGRNAIASLFPAMDAEGQPISYQGDLTLFQGVASNGAIRTVGGGDIQLLTPGGRTTIGVEGIVPASGTNVAPAGVVTQGSGNIQIYSQGSILLGLSRIMTTFGGDITAWSATGDINAGRGAKTTVVYTPLLRTYDTVGNVTQSPNVPATGAGVSVQNPIPEVPPGDVDMIAPEGTIDAGEAGIRASGNVNVAALQVVNAANIRAQGETTGVPVVAAVNVGALTAASTAATSAASAAQDVMRAGQNAARQGLPSIISVQVLGFGPDGAAPASSPSAPAAPGPQTRARPQYDAALPMQVVGLGANVDSRMLTPQEQRLLKQDR